MSKKWLSSVALGALLIAGEALGITVHDVLSNGFWSAEQRGTEAYLQSINAHPEDTVKWRKFKFNEDENGNFISSWVNISTGPKINGVRWTRRWSTNFSQNEEGSVRNEKSKLISKRDKMCKEKTSTTSSVDSYFGYGGREDLQSKYTVKSLSPDMRPMMPFTVDDWFPAALDQPRVVADFYGKEHIATTNIVSDNEAYIQGVIRESGYIHTCYDYVVEEPAFLLQKYTTHIIANATHMYQESDFYTVSTNSPDYITQEHIHTQYSAAFKKGLWKKSTETISQLKDLKLTERCGGTVDSDINTTSIHNEPAPTYGVRSGVAVDEHTQSMLDELNRSAGVRVVVRSTKEPSTTLAAAGSGKAPIQQQEDEQSGNNRAARTGPRVRVIRNPSFDRRKLNGGNDGI